MEKSFPLAPMSGLIRGLTVFVWALPVVFFAAAALTEPGLAFLGVFLLALYAWVYLRFRPTSFVVGERSLQILWPLKRSELPRAEIADARVVGSDEVKGLIGWAVRVGAGGLWGGFGWLWTSRRGMVRMYVSRMDSFVWMETRSGRAWLLTPERPEEFVRALTS